MALLFGLDDVQKEPQKQPLHLISTVAKKLADAVISHQKTAPTSVAEHPQIPDFKDIGKTDLYAADHVFPDASKSPTGEVLSNDSPNNSTYIPGDYGSRFSAKPEDLPWYMRPARTVNDAVVGTIKDVAQRGVDLFYSLGGLSGKVKDNGVMETSTLTDNQQKVDRVAKMASLGLGMVNTAFTPLTAYFQGATQVPGVGEVFKVINTAFEKTGEVGGTVGDFVTDKLPVSDETKNNLRPVLRETFALLAQIGLGKVALDGPTKAKLIDYEKLTKEMIEKDSMVQEKINAAQQKPSAIAPALATPVSANPIVEEASNASTPIVEGAKPIGTVVPIEGTGEVKTRGLSAGVEQTAIENKLTEGFGDLPEYKTMNIKEQAKLASDIISNDYEQAKRIALGQETAPAGVHPEALYTAVELKATKEGDVQTLRDLAVNSTLTTEATTMGQRIKLLDDRNAESPVKAIRELSKAREEAVKKKVKDVSAEKKKIAKEIDTEIKAVKPKKQTWTEFVKSIQC